jgi:hypothetical protein
MMPGSFPPSSSVTRLSVAAAADSNTRFPVNVDPVNVIRSIPECQVIHGPRLSPPVTTLKTPGGNNSLSGQLLSGDRIDDRQCLNSKYSFAVNNAVETIGAWPFSTSHLFLYLPPS